MRALLSNLANRQTDIQTDKRTRANAFTSSFVRGKLTRTKHAGGVLKIAILE